MLFASLSCKLQSPRVAGSSLILESELHVFTDALFNFQKKKRNRSLIIMAKPRKIITS